MTRRWKAWLLVGACALSFRAAYLWRHPAPQALAGDASEYHAYAVSLLDGGRYAGPRGELAGRMPGYPLFLASVYAAFGRSTTAVTLVQCALGILACLFLYGAATRLLEPPWPLFCGLSAAVYYDLIAPVGAVLSECLYSFLLSAFAALILSESGPAGPRAALAGTLLAGAYLVRPECLPWALGVTAALPWLTRRYNLRQAACGLAVPLLVAGLWIGRNYRVFDRIVPLTSVGSFNLYLGLRLPLEKQSLRLEPLPPPDLTLPELERDALFRKRFADLARGLSLGRLARAYVFNFASLFYPFPRQYDVTYAALVPFWLMGFWAARRKRLLWPFCGLVLFSTLTYTVFGGPVSRYRYGFSPYLILLAAVGLEWAGKFFPRRKLLWALGGWSALNALVWGASETFRQLALWVRGGIVGA